MAREIRKIGVVGAGTMGSGIAQLCAQKGFEVVLTDIDLAQLDRAKQRIGENLGKLLEKGKITQEDKEIILERISYNGLFGVLMWTDFVIEAVFEDKKVKQHIFKELDALCSKEMILASNTSTIPICQVAKSVNNKKRVIGMHFMNPPTVMPLIEVIRSEKTSDETFQDCLDLCVRLGKTVVEAKRDTPGFIVNRILFPSINEAVYAFSECLGSAEDIDKAMEMGGPYKMGPLKVADLIGLDVCLHILEILYHELKDNRYKPCPLWKQFVAEGHLGRKTKKGFYEYE